MKRLALLILILAAGLALWWWGVAGRLVHPARHAITGTATLSADAYADAAHRALPAGARIETLTFPDAAGPDRGGPVEIAADTGARIYLDPPTARVLDQTEGAQPEAERALARPALSPDAALLLARPLANGAAPTRIDWPGDHVPDWTIRFKGRDGTRTIKVADDTGTATPALVPRAAATRLVRAVDGDAAIAVLAAAAILLATVWIAIRLRRPRPKPRKRK
jgi:hypothetical protein